MLGTSVISQGRAVKRKSSVVNRERVVLHQTADKKPAPPAATYSGTLDWDRWEIGNAQEMDGWIQTNWAKTTPVPPPVYDDWLYMVCLQEGLREHLEPDKNSVIVGTLHAGAIVKVDDVGGSSSWVKYRRAADGLEVWANVVDGYDVNMQRKT